MIRITVSWHRKRTIWESTCLQRFLAGHVCENGVQTVKWLQVVTSG